MGTLHCLYCKKTINYGDKLIGRAVKCPGCHRTLQIPSRDRESVDPPAFRQAPESVDPTVERALRELSAIRKDVRSIRWNVFWMVFAVILLPLFFGLLMLVRAFS